MLDETKFRDVVARAALAPSTHNTQPARWQLAEPGILIFCDPEDGLAVGDPDGRDAALSCGAAVEATVLALSALGIGAEVTDLAGDTPTLSGPDLQPIARIAMSDGAAVDGLAQQLEHRFTWRGLFDDSPVDLFGWSRSDAVLITDRAGRDRIAGLNDWASHEFLQDGAFRRELVSWMRLSDRHPRRDHDGLSRAAMRMSRIEALAARQALGWMWPLLGLVGATRGLTAEGDATRSAPVIACFHRPAGESPVTTGRAYLRMCLEAASLGLAGWPMAALVDHPETREEVCAAYGIGGDRRLVQVIRFGKPTGAPPPRARKPLSELIISN